MVKSEPTNKLSVPIPEELTQLIERDAIRQLVNEYCQRIWESDVEGWVSLFAENAVIDEQGMGIEIRVSGHSDLRGWIRGAMATRKPRPFVHNHVVTLVDATHAVGTAQVIVLDGSTSAFERNAIASYKDSYVKVNGQWVFELRKLTFVSVSQKMSDAMPRKNAGHC